MSEVLETVRPESVGLSSEGLAKVDAALQAIIDSGELAGAVTLVARHGKVVHRSRMGVKDIETKEPLKDDTIFRIFSMTKPVTAVAMMVLWDEGKWRPEDPVSKHLPEWAGMKVWAEDGNHTPTTRGPTVGHLMTHTAGILYGFNPADPIDALYAKARMLQSESLADMSRKIAGLPLAYEPGEKWIYSLAMDVQGAIIERLTGMSLSDFMRTRIFEPLGMKDTGFSIAESKIPRLATLYRARDDNSLEKVERAMIAAEPAKEPLLASGGGGLMSTVPDYARFAQMLLNKGELDGVRIISPEAATLMMSNAISDKVINGFHGVGRQQIRPGFGYAYNGAVFYEPSLVNSKVGKGTYQWDGAAGTWFWVDPTNDLLYVGMIQRLGNLNAPGVHVQNLTQDLIGDAIL
jgi:CubicO group peptidase (beta-lactamase class C family)